MKNKSDIRALGEDKVFDLIYKLLAVSVICAASAPIASIFLSINRASPSFILLLHIASIILGYSLQALVSRLIGCGRATRSTQPLSAQAKKAQKVSRLPVAITALIIAFIVKALADSWLRYLASIDRNFLYDSYSLQPYLMAITVAILIIVGALLWFFPFDKLATYKGISGIVSVNLINFVLAFMYGSGYILPTLCLFVSLIGMMLLFNQSHVLRTFDMTSDSAVTPEARIYNIALVVLIVVGLLALSFGIWVVVSGIAMLGKLILYSMIGSFVAADTGESEVVIENIDENVFGMPGLSAPPAFGKAIFVVFIIISVLVILYLVFGRGKGILRRIGRFLMMIYSKLVEFFLDPLAGLSETRFGDYSESKRRIVIHESYIDGVKQERKIGLSYHDFTRALAKCRNDAERIALAYATLVVHWREMGFGIKKSDTPSEVCQKLDEKTSIESSGEITSLFEGIKYASPGTVDADPALLSKMCELVRRYREKN